MKLKEWKEHYDKIMDENIDIYPEEKGSELVVPDPLKSKEYQLALHRKSLSEMIHSKKADEIISEALKLICNQMPQTISKDVWDSVSEEFSHCEYNILQYLEADEEDEDSEDQSDTYVPIYKMCGLSLQTLKYCYTFGQFLYEKKEFEHSKSVMLFLMQIAPQIPEFWIATAMCDKKMGNFQAAIDVYELAETIFPDNPSIYLFCADNCLASGDTTNAKIQLDYAKELIDHTSNTNSQWKPTYDYLSSKVA